MITRMFNKIIYVLRIILFLVCTIATIYIVMMTYLKNGKNYSNYAMELVTTFLPFVLILILLVFNIVTKQEFKTENTVYNVSAFMGTIAMLVVCYRSLFDSSITLFNTYEYSVNFDYFAIQLNYIECVLYLIFACNIFLIIYERTHKKKLIIE